MVARCNEDVRVVGTTRREFVESIVGTLVGANALFVGMPGLTSAEVSSKPSPPPTESVSKENYPPLLQGISGQDQAAMEAAHSLRDGDGPSAADDLSEKYDLIIVGAGMSGLSAAYFYRKALPDSKILILDACDDFGGHARRNEFNVGGHQLIAAGGTYMIMFPDTYTPEGKALLAEIGISSERFYRAAKSGAEDAARYNLSASVFFDRETFGVDKLVGNAPAFHQGNQISEPSKNGTWAEFLAHTPLSKPARRDIQFLVDYNEDPLPQLNMAEKIKRLRRQSYSDYLKGVLHIGHDAMTYLQNQFGGVILNVGAGPDSFSAWRAYNAHYPGFKGMNLPPIRVSSIVRDDQIGPDIHLPDGNGSIARLLVRWLIPEALPGNTMEDSIAPRLNYSLLDRSENDVRIRLGSTVVRAIHDGEFDTSQAVRVTYVKEGKTYRVQGNACVMACFNAVVPYLCPELPTSQKEALRLAVRKPLVAANVAIRNWRGFAKLNTRMITAPGCFYSMAILDLGINLGGYRNSTNPDEPATILMYHAPNFPGMTARDQYRSGRADLLRYSLEDYKHQIYSQLGRMLGSSGFNPDRDIAGVTFNRWAHGYACGTNDLYDPDVSLAESPWVRGRQRFGRIVIANSDAAGVSLTQAAFDQANRAVKELLYNVADPMFYYSNPPRG